MTFGGINIGITAGWRFVPTAAGVNSPESTFYMSGRDLMLDVDGTGAQAAVRVATLQIGATVAASDLDVYF